VAVAQARRRCGRGVDVVRARIPHHWPDGRFDLVVLSEVGYYCTDLGLLVERLRDALTDDGIVVACHWRRPASDHPHTGDAVHAALAAGLRELTRTVHHVETDFLLDVWTRDGRSVAQAEGIVD
jgi:SAM-dependent methyltransferase